MGKHKKITWDVIFKDFRANYPKYKGKTIDFRPYDYATILLIFPDGTFKTYNYDTKELKVISKKDVRM